MNDEDWIPGLGVTYSNTISSASGSLNYGTIDVGYDLLRSDWYKVGGFIGYNFYKYAMDAHGCTQIADQNSGICTVTFPVSPSALVISESDTWNS